MVHFHEHTFWQQAFVALMDLHNTLDEEESGKHNAKVVEDLLSSAQGVAAAIADSLTRRDRRISRELREGAVGVVAMTRTHLAVAWSRGLLDDDTFRGLDEKYAGLSDALQK